MAKSAWGIKSKNEGQEQALKALLDPSIDMVVLSGLAGSGKEQPISALVSTPNGFKRMRDIQVGDVVNGYSGTANVIGVFPQGVKPVYRLTFSDGRTCEAGLEHLWEVKTHSQLYAYRRTGVNRNSIRTTKEIINYSGTKGLFVKTCKAVEYSTREQIIPPYSLGVLIGDGALIDDVLVIRSSEADIVSRVCFELGVVSSRNKYNYDHGFTTKCNKHYRKYLSSIGLCVKLEYRYIPENYLYADINQRRELLAGLMDTAGHVTLHGSFQFCTCSTRLKDEFITLCRGLGYVVTVSEDTRQGKYTTGICYKVTIKTSETIFKSDKHYNRLLVSKSVERSTKYRHDHLKIISVEYVRDEESQCIMLDSEDHLYLTNNYVVTHNTLLALAAGLEQVAETKMYKEIVFTRAPAPVGDDMGFLPGEIEDKLLPWCGALLDNLEYLNVDSHLQERKIKMMAMMHMRGRSLNNRYVIIDETQNITAQQLKVLITRAGENTKIVCLGDMEQIDSRKLTKENNGLTYLIKKATGCEFIKVVEVPEGVRSRLATWGATEL